MTNLMNHLEMGVRERVLKKRPRPVDLRTEKAERRTLSEIEIVRRVRAGETGLFELLFRRHRQCVYRVARAKVHRFHSKVDRFHLYV